MATKEIHGKPEPPVRIAVGDPAQLRGEFKRMGGSQSDDWNNRIVTDTAAALWLKNSDDATKVSQMTGAIAALVGIGPKDELGHQKVTVEHVHVHDGGQAIVGAVEAPGGGMRAGSEEQPHAKQITHAPEQALRCEDSERERVTGSGDAERPMPNARWPVPRRAKG